MKTTPKRLFWIMTYALKNMKRILAVFLALAMCITVANTAFAAELDTPVQEEDIDEMYDSKTIVIPAYSSVTTSSFYIPDPHFAFESQGNTSTGGTTTNGSYLVELKQGSGTLASNNVSIDGYTYKVDWISVYAGTYYFKITNYSNTAIRVVLTYYSWA